MFRGLERHKEMPLCIQLVQALVKDRAIGLKIVGRNTGRDWMRFNCAHMQINYRMTRAARTFKCGIPEHSVKLGYKK